MSDLNIIIDPGGLVGVRPGINIQVFPNGDQPLTWEGETFSTEARTASGMLLASGFDEFLSFSWESLVSLDDYKALQRLRRWTIQNRSKGLPYEVVLYNLTEPYSEIAETRTRFIVPTTPIISQVEIQSSPLLYEWVYWVAVQGVLDFTGKQMGECYQVEFKFTEGTRLLSNME